MKPAPFDYLAPTTVDETMAELARRGDDAKILAGGQSLMPMLNFRLARPAVVIDINRVGGLDGLTATGGVVRIGALVRQRAVERWAAEPMPVVAAALRLVGHVAIRNRGTVVGSLVHGDPAAELPALLLALGGRVIARSAKRERTIAADALFQGPLMTSIAADELAVAAEWPLPASGRGWGFHEVARRHGDFALVGVVALASLRGGRVHDPCVALFGVGATPVRARDAEAALADRAPTPALIDGAAAAGAAALLPEGDLHASADYRRRVARTLIARALRDALARATER